MRLFRFFKKNHRKHHQDKVQSGYRCYYHGQVSQIQESVLPQSSVMLELLESGCPEKTKAAIGQIHAQKQQNGNFCPGCENGCDLAMPQCKKGREYAKKMRN